MLQVVQIGVLFVENYMDMRASFLHVLEDVFACPEWMIFILLYEVIFTCQVASENDTCWCFPTILHLCNTLHVLVPSLF